MTIDEEIEAIDAKMILLKNAGFFDTPTYNELRKDKLLLRDRKAQELLNPPQEESIEDENN